MSRSASIERNTKETDIRVTLELDGTGQAELDTGIGFFDHMLDGFARHGLFDLNVYVVSFPWMRRWCCVQWICPADLIMYQMRCFLHR